MAPYSDDDIPFEGEYLDFAELSRDELQAKLLELLTLVETSRELLRAKDADDMARRVLLSAIGVLGASAASVLRHDPVSGEVQLVEQFGLEEPRLPRLALGPQLAAEFVAAGPPRSFRVDETLAAGPAASLLAVGGKLLEHLEAEVIHPLVGRAGLLGFLVLGRRLLAEGYSIRDLELFASLADLYTLALERAGSPVPHAPAGEPMRRRSAHLPSESEVHQRLARLRREHPPLQQILGESRAVLGLFDELVQFSDSRATILIQGESGTGKELVAKAIHALSRRRHGPFEVVDCSSIPKELIESELFGHVRGAFTGAVRDRRGAFELAHQGTLFLDEIGDMTLASQTRLLRVLQEGKFRPVGGEKTRSVDVRVVAATNVDLRQAVTQGTFRKDLFYRIQVFPLRLPPLRERTGDIEVLTRAFLKRFYADLGLAEPQLDAEVVAKLQRHSFPGNVRELQNIVEALAIRSRREGRVSQDHLREVFHSQRIATSAPAAEPVPSAATAPSSTPTRDSPGQMVRAAWAAAGFNLLEASRQLRARRLDGEAIPVVDRVQLSHYLDGEVLIAFQQAQGFESTVARLASHHPLRHRAIKRVRRVLSELCRAAEREAKAAEVFPRLPEEYRPVLAQLMAQGKEWLLAHARDDASGPSS